MCRGFGSARFEYRSVKQVARMAFESSYPTTYLQHYYNAKLSPAKNFLTVVVIMTEGYNGGFLWNRKNRIIQAFFFFYSCNVGEFDVLIQSDSVAGEWT